jgi:hypothetical protein
MISTLGPSLCLWMRYGTLRGRKGMICADGMILTLPMDKASFLHLLSYSDVPPAACTVFRLVVVCIHLMSAHYGKGSAPLSIFIFQSLNSTPTNDGDTSSPHIPPQLHLLFIAPPPLSTLSFSWLSHSFIKWRPPKVEAAPTSLFIDQFHFGAPDKGTSCSGHKPGHRAPEVDSWGAAVP